MTSPGTFNKVVLALINYLGNTPTREKVNSRSSSSSTKLASRKHKKGRYCLG